MLRALQVLFIGFKLLGVIDWSWWQVLIPTFIIIVLAFSQAILEEVNKS